MRTIFASLLLLPLAACGGDDDSSGDPDGGIDAPGTQPRDKVGRVEILEERWVFPDDSGPMENLSGRVYARFFQGREPQFHRETLRGGDCVLLTHELVSCTPACTTGLCVDTNVCEPFATYVWPAACRSRASPPRSRSSRATTTTTSTSRCPTTCSATTPR